MSADSDRMDDSIAEQLAAWDDALKAGKSPRPPSEELNSESGRRLAKGLACLKMLRRMRGASTRNGDTSPNGSTFSTVRGQAAGGRAADGSDVPPQSRLGRFEIRRELGRGGYGVVFLAYDPQLRREVALKVPRAETLMELGLRARFEHEARAAAGLRHPHIVQIHEAGDVGAVCYIASAFCPGINLAEWLRQRREPMPCADAAQLIATLSDAIDHAHQHGVLHRDLKPANVILQYEAKAQYEPAAPAHRVKPSIAPNLPSLSQCEPVITDFGLALTTQDDSRCTLTGTILGTPNYMAPEQAVGKRDAQGTTTDIYALGAILYELLTGRVPFQGDSPFDTLQQVISTDPVSPVRLRPSIPRDLETICLKCLQKEPHKRYGSASELRDDLLRYLRNEPILARPVSVPERVWRWCRRRPLDAVLACSLILAVTSGILGVSWLWRKAEQGRIATAAALERVNEVHQDVLAQQDRSEVLSYLHDVSLAHHECLADNPARASLLLDGCPPSLRNWEWYFLQRLSHADLQTYGRHRLPAVCVTLSPDGRLIASSSGLWGVPHPGQIKLWDSVTGRELYEFAAHTGAIMELAFHPDGSVLAAAEVSWTPRPSPVRLFDITSGKELLTISNASNTFSVCFSPDGKLLALGGSNARITIHETATGKLLRVLEGPRGNVFCVRFHRDGRRLASASRDGTVHLFDSQTGEILQVFENLDGDARRVAFTRDGRLLVTASWGGLIRVWDLVSKKELASHQTRPEGICGIDLSPDGRWLSVVYRPSGLEIWDTLGGRQVRKFSAHASGPVDSAFSPDGTRLVSCGIDGTVKEWDLTVAQEPITVRVQQAYISELTNIAGSACLAVSTTRNTASSSVGAGDYTVKLWDPAEPKVKRVFQGHKGWLTGVKASPDGKQLVSTSEDKTVRVWDTGTGNLLHTLQGHSSTVNSAVFQGDGRYVVSAGEDRTLRRWDAQTGQALRAWQGHDEAIQCVVAVPGGNIVASAGDDAAVKLWDAVTGQELACLRAHSGQVLALAVSLDGRRLASAGSDAVIHLWRLPPQERMHSLQTPEHSLRGHNGQVTDLVFAASGTRLASVSAGDDTVRLWDVEAGHEALRLPSMERSVSRLAFSLQGDQLFVSGRNEIRTYDAGRAIPSPEERRQSWQERIAAWHERQAQASENEYAWFAASWHLDRMLARSPDRADWLMRRGHARAQLAEWKGACEDFDRVAELIETREHSVRHLRGLAQLGAGDMSAYYATCQELLAEFGATRDPILANGIASMATLLPPPESDLAWLIDMAEFAELYATNQSRRHAAANTLGTALYRAGRYQESADSVLNSIEYHGEGGELVDWLVLALAHYSMGNVAESRTWWEKAQQAVRDNPDLISPTVVGTKSYWWSRLENVTLYREANERLASLSLIPPPPVYSTITLPQ